MKQYKIELFTKPIFDDQYKYRVFEVDYGKQASEYKETPVLSGNDTLDNINKEIKFWLITSNLTKLAEKEPEHYEVNIA